MKFKIEKNKILSSLKFCNSICSLNPMSSPILASLLIEVKKDYIKLISSNNAISSELIIDQNDFECILEGKILIKSKTLYDIIQKLDNGTIIFEKIDDNILSIKSNDFTSNINLLNFEEYPNITFNLEKYNEIKFNINNLIEIETKLQNLVKNSQENVTILNGINFNVNNNLLEVVASDSFRIGYLKYNVNFNGNLNFTIDPIVLKVLSNLYSNNQEEITFKINNEKILIEYEKTNIVIRPFQEKYPNIKTLFVDDFLTEIKLNKKELNNSIERSLILNSNRTNPTLNFTLQNDNEILLESSSNEIGFSSEILKIEKIKGDNLKFKINIPYFLSLLKNIDGEEITIHYNSEISPIFIKDISQENFIQLVALVK